MASASARESVTRIGAPLALTSANRFKPGAISGAPGKKRPKLVVGFAAETTDLETNARSKLSRKGCDWIVGNDVSDDVFGADGNTVTLFAKGGTAETWPRQSKAEVARKLAARIADHFKS